MVFPLSPTPLTWPQSQELPVDRDCECSLFPLLNMAAAKRWQWAEVCRNEWINRRANKPVNNRHFHFSSSLLSLGLENFAKTKTGQRNISTTGSTPTVFVVVQLLSLVWLLATPWTAAHQASPSYEMSTPMRRFKQAVATQSYSNSILLSTLKKATWLV